MLALVVAFNPPIETVLAETTFDNDKTSTDNIITFFIPYSLLLLIADKHIYHSAAL
jgi:hypothetical protein